MERSYKEAVKHRRSCYAITNRSPIGEAEIEERVRWTIAHVPSAFNSQSSRLVLLLGEHHPKLWRLVRETLRGIVPPEAFAATEQKIGSFAAGYGTVLYFEDESVVKDLQERYPAYAENFPVWSAQTSAMHQITLWTLLDDAGLGASLQHYNPLIDREVSRIWALPAAWRLIAQMPFGAPAGAAAPKTFLPVEDRIRVFK
ncbi:MAG: nitroreductase family protein [Tannerella sp.]|jgi:predicted oxidoreductase (fatty acid repression mutant protein)|nr:nitroreductase family protein [Tannerella sp.]